MASALHSFYCSGWCKIGLVIEHLLSGGAAQQDPNAAACYGMLSPRLQSVVLDMACFPEGLDSAAAEAIWGLSCPEDAASLQSLGLVSCRQRSPQQPLSLTVHDSVKALGLHLADQAWARRVVSPDGALAVLDLSKVCSDHEPLAPALAMPCTILNSLLGMRFAKTLAVLASFIVRSVSLAHVSLDYVLILLILAVHRGLCNQCCTWLYHVFCSILTSSLYLST